MKEIQNNYKQPVVKNIDGAWGVYLEKDSGSSTFETYSTEKDAKQAIGLARHLQVIGLPLNVYIKIVRTERPRKS